MGGKTRNIAIQLVLHSMTKTKLHVFIARFTTAVPDWCITFAVGGQHFNVSLVEQVVVKPQALEEPCISPCM